MDTIYRFRPVSRLLSEDGKAGELDSQYIYFADPIQLNDPLEGYKDLFFSGDGVVWDNLFRHYIRCLINECMLCADKSQERVLGASMDIFSTRRNLPQELSEINDKVYGRIVSDSAITRYIDYLGGGRRIHQHELVSHLNLIHLPVLSAVLEVLNELGGCEYDTEAIAKERKNNLANIESMLEQMPVLGAADELLSSLFRSARDVANEILLLRKCDIDKTSENDLWTYLRYEYPEAFGKALESLVYPNWYTACFMEGCADSSIWGTYGGNHKDVCLKFKVDNSDGYPSIKLNTPVGYGGRGVEVSYIKHQLYKVSYEKNFISIDFFRSLGKLTIPQINDWYYSATGVASVCALEVREDEAKWRKDYWANFYHSVTVKLKAWDREQEWRMVMAPNIMDFSSSESRKLKYDFNCLEGIIFGINTSLVDKSNIIKRVRELCVEFGRKEFSFYQARYDSHSRAIAYDRLNLIKV